MFFLFAKTIKKQIRRTTTNYYWIKVENSTVQYAKKKCKILVYIYQLVYTSCKLLNCPTVKLSYTKTIFFWLSFFLPHIHYFFLINILWYFNITYMLLILSSNIFYSNNFPWLTFLSLGVLNFFKANIEYIDMLFWIKWSLNYY